LIYNLGAFAGSLTSQPYAKNDTVYAARAVWLPLASRASKEEPKLLHLAFEARYGSPLNGSLQFKSKPESFPAQQNAVDTGKIPASGHTMLGLEAYYRPGPLMFGSEYFLNSVFSNDSGTLFFHGGEAFAAWLLTGETRSYNDKGGFFEAVSPARPVFSGGPGAWELVFRASYVDLDSKTVQGGRFWRVTPMMNWHLSDNARFEFVYGYGVLDRFGVQGASGFFQTRLQLTLA
jgi:phosphate-selective porin OprO/OprP